MGVVYKARQRDLDRLVALKILPSATERDPAFAERFAREARALARLSHPNIVAVYESGQTAGLYYFVMEYVDGLNLRQLLASGKIAPREALAIVPQICEALQTAHDQGIVHRDIKPENILLDKKGRVKIADFGIAKIMGGAERDMTLTGMGEMVGTPAYMAPEQIEHPGDVDHRADIYSLGVVFYQMLTGELPLGKFAAPSRKVQVDVRLDEVVMRALEKEPELRYQQASEVKTRVETIVGSGKEAPSEREPATPASHSPSFGKLALGILLLGLLGAPVLEAFSRRPDSGTPFAGICLLLALVFGLIARRTRLGRGVATGVILLAVVMGAYISIAMYYDRLEEGANMRRMKEAEVEAVAAAEKADNAPARQAPVADQGPAPAEQVLAEYQWPPLAGGLAHEQLVNADGRTELKIENTTDAPLQLSLLTIDKPPVTSMIYELTGEIRYEGVAGTGYLEMWSDFPQGKFFSRTLGAAGSGPMGQIAGSSSWRTFELPFNRTGSTALPARLEFNIFLPGRGVVFISPVKLIQVGAPENSPVVIDVRSDGSILIDHQPVSSEDLAARLQQLGKRFPDQPVIIRGDQNTDEKLIYNILDLCRQAKIWNVAFANASAVLSEATPAPSAVSH